MVFHALMLGTEAEVKRGSPFYQSLAARLRGSFTPILLPQDTGAYKRGFSGLAARFYHPYSASLVCGHMSCGLVLYPDPNLGRDVPPAEMHPAVAAEAVGKPPPPSPHQTGYESGYGYCLPSYGTGYRRALRTTRTRLLTRTRRDVPPL